MAILSRRIPFDRLQLPLRSSWSEVVTGEEPVIVEKVTVPPGSVHFGFGSLGLPLAKMSRGSFLEHQPMILIHSQSFISPVRFHYVVWATLNCYLQFTHWSVPIQRPELVQEFVPK